MEDRSHTNLIFPGVAGIYDSLADWAYPLLRATAGLMLLPHAWPKFMVLGAQGVAANALAKRGIEPALPIAYLIMFLESVGAICITIGFLTRPFALLLLIEMLFFQCSRRRCRIHTDVGGALPHHIDTWRRASFCGPRHRQGILIAFVVAASNAGGWSDPIACLAVKV